MGQLLFRRSPRVVQPRKNSIVLIGHSFVQNCGSADSSFGGAGITNPGTVNGISYSKGVFERANILLKQPFTVLSNLGVSGQTSTQILARFGAAVALNPGWIYLDCHSNDYYQGITAAQSIANTLAMIKQANGAGIAVILALDIPRGAGYAQSSIQALMQVSDYFKDYAVGNSGLVVFDQWPYFLDTSSIANAYNGVPLASTVLSDSIHPSAYGAGLAAQGLASLLAPLVPVARRRSSCGSDGVSNGDLAIVTKNPMHIGTGGFSGTGGSGVWGDSGFGARWIGSTIAGVGSKVTRASVAATFPGLFDDGVQGGLQAIALTNASGANSDIFYFTVSTGDTAADFATKYAGTGPWVAEAEVGATSSSGNLNALYLSVNVPINTSTNYLVTSNYNLDSGDYLGVTKFQGVLRTRPFYMPTVIEPSGTPNKVFVGFYMGIQPNATANVYIGNMHMRRVLA